MMSQLTGPIGILDEHPAWSRRLLEELDRRGLPWERIDHSSHGFAPDDRRPRHSVIVNRTSPSSHTRGHRGVLFYAEALLAYYEALGIPVINPVAAYRHEKSKALQLGVFEQVGARYPRTVVVNHPAELARAGGSLRFPVLIKPNVGGSGAGIVRIDGPADLGRWLDRLDFGPDGTVLVQEYLEAEDGAIVRVEILDGQYLYAIRLVRETGAGFNLCPADICQPDAGSSARDGAAGVCPASATPGLTVTRFDPPAEAIATVVRLTRAAGIDVGGIEYLVASADGRIYYYDINATSNFVANAPALLGFDPTARFADYISRRALQAAGQVAA